MEQRLNAYALGNKAMKSLHGIGQAIKASNLDEKLLHLVYFRVSQMNSCAFCLDMHSKDALAAGDTDQRLFVVSAWRETPFFTDEDAQLWPGQKSSLNLKVGFQKMYTKKRTNIFLSQP